MKRVLFSMLLLLSPVLSFAHPGKTDWQDGHKCLKHCEEWDLYYEEYHLHDKDRNPIRIPSGRNAAVRIPPPPVSSGNPAPATVPEPEPVVTRPMAEAGLMPRTAGIPVAGTVVRQEAMIRSADILLLIVVVLLLISLILLRRRKERP